ncbi:MAG TPA: aryl-sulfate sulfotransferase [Edaphobacter sp.]|nr:aryl-sulfate sulfotransferase [Edaphobacter sp.]
MALSKLLLIMTALVGTPLYASVSVQLTSPTSTIEVGQALTFTATGKDSKANASRFSYQFTMRPHNQGKFTVMQDYYWTNTFPWTPSDHEGVYDIGVTAWSSATGESAPTYVTVHVNPRVTGTTPVVSNTNNSLVALYSAPACTAPTQMRVQLKPSGSTTSVNTPYKPCNGLTMNFYIAGMLANTTYTIQHSLTTGSVGPPVTYTTGKLPTNINIPTHLLLTGDESPTATTYPFLLHATDGAAPYATDLNDNVVWYRTPNYPYDSGYMTHLIPGGTFLTIDDDPVDSKAVCKGASATACGDHQFLREYDLAGNVIRSTSWAVVNDKVNALRASQGGSQVRLNFFSHEGIRLPNGYTVTLATDEEVKNLTTGTQDVFGDVVIVLDTNWQVVWAWNSFDYLDINRMTIGGTCLAAGPGCPAQFFRKKPNGQLYSEALDWTHANSVSYDPSDGNLIISFRHQSWAVKINYKNARGNGDIVWKLGYDGSFALASGFPVSDWFSGQHDVQFQSNGLLTLFDNNNASSVTEQTGGTAHGQAWNLDTSTMTATPVVDIDLRVISQAVGSAVLLSNGNYEWQAGFINNDQAQTFEYTPSGSLIYKQQSNALTYRSFRLTDLYTP